MFSILYLIFNTNLFIKKKSEKQLKETQKNLTNFKVAKD